MTICMTSANEFTAQRNVWQVENCIARIAKNDKAALAELYQETRACVYGFALSVLKNTHDAEDVLHDCYMAVWSSAQNYRPQGKPMAWVYTITRNLCLMKLRERKKSGVDVPENWEGYLEEKESVTAEDKLFISECMKTLADQERQIVILYAVGGFKHREIAEMLSLPLATVLSKYNRAMKKLKAQFMKGEQG